MSFNMDIPTRGETTRGSMVFAPAPNKPLHVGNALALLLNILECERNGWQLRIRWDCDFGTERRGGEESILESAERLGAKNVRSYYDVERADRYEQVMVAMLKAGVAEKYGPDELPIANNRFESLTSKDAVVTVRHGHTEDLIQGRVREWGAAIFCRNNYSAYFNMSFTNVVDWTDFHCPLHIRDAEHVWRIATERILARDMALVMAVRLPQYAHIPTVCTADGKALHKSDNPAEPLMFNNWAKQYVTRAALRHALLSLILDHGTEYSLSNIRRASKVLVDAEGRRRTRFGIPLGVQAEDAFEWAPPHSGMATI